MHVHELSADKGTSPEKGSPKKVVQFDPAKMEATSEEPLTAPQIKEERVIDPKVKEMQIKNTSYFRVLANRRGFFGFLALVLGLMLWTKIDTTLEYKLREDFGYSPSIVAIFYTI